MSWQVATYAILALLLVGGFLWYERSRPSARVVGLVAALAALAAAGRIAFAPLPNVTPTTDIALLSGYALGGPPGFMVGALAALVSNFWLGQGPWTPWQMGAWGITGVAGAALAVATARRLGRWGLALACGLAGLLYGVLLDLSLMVTYGGEQSLERFLALSARGVPFNIAHALGNAAFALAAGPALVRVLERFRARLDFSWRHAPARARPADGAGVPLGSLALLLTAVALVGAAAQAQAEGAGSARGYLERAQNRDGGLPATPGGSSSAVMTGWAMLGLEASGRNPLDLRRKGRSPIDYLRSQADQIRSTGDLERTILALDAAGVDPRSFAGRDLVGELAGRRSKNGSFQGQVNLTAFGILALRATGTTRSQLRRSASWLREARNDNGGWGFQPGVSSDADSTGAALQGLAAAGSRGKPVKAGVAFLRRAQRSDGGWSLAAGGPTNSQSTAWAVQGLLSAGADPAAVRSGGRSPFDYLASRQAKDGHYRYSKASDQTPVWVTGQALMAVAREPFPLAAVPRARQPGGTPLDGAGSAADAALQSGRGGSPRGGKRGKDRGADNRAESAAPPRSAVAAISGSGGGSALPDSTTFEAAAEASADETALYVGAGFGALALALAGGFLVYRRRLP